MKSKAVFCAVIALTLPMGGPAFADRDGDRNDRGRNEQSQRGGKHDRRDDDRRDDRGRSDHDRRGAGPNHAFHRGGRLPAEFRHRQFVVDDWRSHRLSAPPRGYHWVQTGSDYVLVAITTGIILQIFLNG